MKNFILITGILLIGVACQPKEESGQEEKTEVPQQESPAFNAENSDAEAVDLAGEVLKAHGGQDSWDNTRYIGWNFLGIRDLVWDKYTGNVRIDFPGQNTTYLININKDSGRVKIGDRELTKNDSLSQYIEKGKQIWVNDSYWLVFPFKFRDPGVQLKYLGQDTTVTGKNAEVISLSFEKVGFTPQNKYKAYVDPQTHLILQWDFYRNSADSAATFQNEWTNYQRYGDIYLSSGRGERSLGNIKVAQEWDDKIFENF